MQGARKAHTMSDFIRCMCACMYTDIRKGFTKEVRKQNLTGRATSEGKVDCR